MGHSAKRSFALPALCLASLVAAHAHAGSQVFQGAGANPAAIQATVDAYRTALGDNNGGTATPFPSGRREIGWDGVPDQFASPNDMPFDLFRNRGALYATPGSAVRVSADSDNPTNSPVRFADINPTYEDIFQAFSEQRLFSPIGSNIVDLTFVLAGTNTPAVSTGFGAVYTDVDISEGTSFEYFDAAGNSLGKFNVLPADNGLSFLGVTFDAPVVRRVRIAYGTDALGPNDGGAVDVAVMDDFLYGEPQAIVNPIPLPPALLGALTLAPIVIAWRRGIKRG